KDMSYGFVARLDRAGAHVHSATFAGSASTVTSAHVAVDAQDRAFVAGQQDGEAEASVWFPPSNMAVVGFGRAGKRLFERRFAPEVWPRGMAVAPDGSVVVSGQLTGAVDFGAGTLRGQEQGFAVALAPDGRTRWAMPAAATLAVAAVLPTGDLVL